MSAWKTWVIEPRDPFIARDGRPFGATAGVRAASLPFPFPSTTTGGVRTRAGLKNGVFDVGLTAAVKKISTRGPLLVQLSDAGEIADWLLPAPHDALLLQYEENTHLIKEKAAVKRLAPRAGYENLTNLPDGLQPVFMLRPDPRKPLGNAPRYWRWQHFQEWLKQPQDQAEITLAAWGCAGPTGEMRTHVSVKPDTQTADDGALFQTRGLEFTHAPTSAATTERLARAQRLALALATDADAQTNTARLAGGLAPLGGERRLMCWRESPNPPAGDLFASSCPAEIRAAIKKDKACRLVLLTPAYFAKGCIPQWLAETRHGVTPKLEALATGRYQVVSGWDFEFVGRDDQGKKYYGRPKPTRRLMPAGAVLFLRLTCADDAGLDKWIDEMWLRCISDDGDKGFTPRADGFGLAALGVWPGEEEK